MHSADTYATLALQPAANERHKQNFEQRGDEANSNGTTNMSISMITKLDGHYRGLLTYLGQLLRPHTVTASCKVTHKIAIVAYMQPCERIRDSEPSSGAADPLS